MHGSWVPQDPGYASFRTDLLKLGAFVWIPKALSTKSHGESLTDLDETNSDWWGHRFDITSVGRIGDPHLPPKFRTLLSQKSENSWGMKIPKNHVMHSAVRSYHTNFAANHAKIYHMILNSPRPLAMQSMLVNCFHWHRRLVNLTWDREQFKEADDGWPWLTPKSKSFFWSILGLGSYLNESLLSITHHGWWYVVITHEKHCESNRVHVKYRNIGTLQIAKPGHPFANLMIITRCVLMCVPGSPAQGEVSIFGCCTCSGHAVISRKWQTS